MDALASPQTSEDQIDRHREYGDWRAVERVFGFKRAYTYSLLQQRRIRTALIPGRGRGGRGRRLFSFASIRQMISEMEDTGERRAPAILRAESATAESGRQRKKT